MTSEEPSTEVQSWGYNQLDDKGAFVTTWYVSYPGWGETYGRGLAQAADQQAFSRMIEGASKSVTATQESLFAEIESQIREADLKDAVVFQTLVHSFEYGEFGNKELFHANYKADCPKTLLNDFDGFIGVLKIAGQNVPVINVVAQDRKLRNEVVVANVSKFLSWDQFAPIDIPEERTRVHEGLFVNVIDLNADELRRERLLSEAPEWLTKHGDASAQLAYLRTHVIVNVYQKFQILIRDSKAAVCVTVRQERDTV